MFFVASGHYTNRNDLNLMGHLDHAYIVSETLPIYPDVASLVKIIAYLYSVVWGKLYMIGLSTIVMQFLEHDEVEYSHAEVHEGISKTLQRKGLGEESHHSRILLAFNGLIRQRICD